MKLHNILVQIYKKHLCFLLLNTLLSLIMIAGCFRYSVFESFHLSALDFTNNPDQIYQSNSHYVECNTPILYYSGYDYMTGHKVTGHYYYALSEDRCRIFLISRKTVDFKETPPDTLDPITIKAHILKHDSNMKPLLTYIANDLNWNYNGISKVTDPYILSQVDYHPIFNLVFLILTIIVLLSNIMLVINRWILRKK